MYMHDDGALPLDKEKVRMEMDMSFINTLMNVCWYQSSGGKVIFYPNIGKNWEWLMWTDGFSDWHLYVLI